MIAEGLEVRARALGERRARRVKSALADAMKAEAPAGVRIEEVAEGVALVGRGLIRRWAIDPALRWLVERTKR
jgi:hypothetical protein